MNVLFTPKQFATRFPPGLAKLMLALHRESTLRAGREIGKRIKRAPVRTGRLAASYYYEETTGPDGGPRVTTGFSATHGHYGADIGRRRSKPFRRRIRTLAAGTPRGRRGHLLPTNAATRMYTRRLGSLQRPKGMSRPAYYGLKRDWDKVLSGVIKDIEAAGFAQGV